MPGNRPTIADLRASKGKRQLVKICLSSLEEAEACAKAGIDMISVTPQLMLDPELRRLAPDCFIVPGLDYGDYATSEDYLRAALPLMRAGADAIYCAAGLGTVRTLREEGIPVIGHVGLIPSQCTWTGGFRAVGRTAESALLVWNQVKALEEAGAFGAEIEVVPERVATAISRRTGLFLISMGSGAGCDAQYLFAEDILGSHAGHYPRHAKTYRNFLAEYRRLQQERINAFAEYAADVRSGAFPDEKRLVTIMDEEYERFLSGLAEEK